MDGIKHQWNNDRTMIPSAVSRARITATSRSIARASLVTVGADAVMARRYS